MMWWYPGAFGWGMMLFSVLLTLAFWAGLVAVVVWAVRTLVGARSRSSQPSQGDQPLEILRRRFAAGEISQEEYERARRALE
jgi:putative membrane protein